MPCYDSRDHDPEYTGAENTLKIRQLEQQLQNEEQRSAWLEAALCLLSNPELTCYATADFVKYIQNVTPAMWKESGIRKQDLLTWKNVHDIEDVKRRALKKLTPEEIKALGLK